MLCPKCNFQNPEGEIVCQKCQSVIAVPAPPPASAPSPTAAIPPSPPAVTEQLWFQEWWVIVLMTVGLGPLGLIIIAVLYRQKGIRLPKIFWALLLVLILPLILIIFALVSFGNISRFSSQLPDRLPETAIPSPAPNLAAADSDGDGVPDDIEAAIGTNPNYQECSEYLQNPCNLLKASSSGAVSQNILIILDSSGSMAEKIGGKTKMDIAKSVLSDYLKNLSQKGYEVGLMVYGHKGSNSAKDKAASCVGIETVLPIGSGADKINSALAQFSPTGWTPIADSLLQAMRVFSEYSNQVEITSPLVQTEKGERVHATPQMANTVLLISDGEETCGGNPVDAAKKLKESGINAVVNVIGFGVDTKTRSQLQSIASAGGGKFLFSSDEESLRKAAEDVQTGIANARSGLDAQICVAQEKHKLLACLNDFYYTRAGKYMKDPASQKTLSEKYKEIETKFDEIVAPFIQSSRNQLQEGVQQIQQGRKDNSAQ